MKRNRYLHIFFAPDDGNNIAIPSGESPTGSAIMEPPEPVREAPEMHMPTAAPVKPQRMKGAIVDKIDVARELGLSEPPSKLLAKAAEEFRARDKTGRFKKVEIAPAKSAPKAKAAEPAKLGEPTPTPSPAPAAPPKIKLNGMEKTEEEWAAYHKELSDKAAKAAEPVKPSDAAPAAPTEPAAPEETPEQMQAKWLDGFVKRFKPDAAAFDKALADGDGEAILRLVAAPAAQDAREFIASQIPAFVQAAIDERLKAFDPLMQQHQQITQYQTEHQFLESNPTIKAHAQGLATMRQVSDDLHAEHDDLAFFISANPNSPRTPLYQARCKELEGANYLPALAKATMERLGIGTQPAQVQSPQQTAPSTCGTANTTKATSSTSDRKPRRISCSESREGSGSRRHATGRLTLDEPTFCESQ